jgi:cytochrome b6-f complex iron-sulfur subunit
VDKLIQTERTRGKTAKTPTGTCGHPCACQSKAGVTRRGFIGWMAAGWTAFTLAAAGMGSMLMRFLAPNVDYEPSQSFRAGSPDDYQRGEVSARLKAKHGVWIVRLEDRIVAISTVCTHLGCTPNWLESEGKFKCPCHGSGFRKTGEHFEGPAPRPLERYKVWLNDDGDIEVNKSIVFRGKKDQWNDPESYVPA